MKNLMRTSTFLGMVMLLGILSSCEKDYYVPETVDVPDNISYSGDIQPIWNSNCINCHKAGSTAPNLEASASYTELNTPKYINTSDPKSSLIYTKVAPGGSMATYMPPGTEVLVLKWIEQGAQDN